MLVIAIWVVSIGLSGAVASHKGRYMPNWVLLAVFFGPLTLAILLASPSAYRRNIEAGRSA